MEYSTNIKDVILQINNILARGTPRGLEVKHSTLRMDMIVNIISRAQDAFPDEIEKTYFQRLAFIDNDDNSLTQEEKDEAKLDLTMIKDRKNLLNKYETYRCDTCDRLGYTIVWCQHCVADFLQDNANKWTSGNEYINRQILLAQVRAPIPEAIPEWIPHETLTDIRYLTQGGYASIYTAEYMRGLYTRWDKQTRTLSRGLSRFKVALKRLKNWDRPEINFRDELEKHIHISSVCNGIVRCYGVTRDPKTKDYMLVLNRLEYDLREHIQKYHLQITWSDINNLCMDIAYGLFYIHKEGLVHRDLHPGNILRGRRDNHWYIADLGLSGPPDQANKVYGNLPYLAPELLSEKKYSSMSDIYAFGMLLYYVTTFKSPFAELEHDVSLQINIVRGGRPIIPDNPDKTQKLYEKIIRRSWDADPNKRPKAGVIGKAISMWTNKVEQTGLVLQNAPAVVDSAITSEISAILTKSSIYDTRDSFWPSSTSTVII